MLTKSKAIAKLQKQINEISTIKTKADDSYSPEFIKWHRDTEIAIENIFGQGTRQIKDFSKISYTVSGFSTASPTLASVHRKVFLEGFDHAAAVLSSLITEIEEYWDDNHTSQRVGMINIESIGNNSIVNIGSILNSVNQSLQVNSSLSLSDKQEIDSLLKELVDVLKQIPLEKVDYAEAVEEMAKDLVENATKEKPNQKLIEISAEGLKKAAKNLVTVLPAVLLISEKLISFILALHR